MYKSIQLIDSQQVYSDGGLGFYKFQNQNKDVLLLNWEMVLNLVSLDGYKYIPFY